jgi:two-component system sensor histidine kinase/response regulator
LREHGLVGQLTKPIAPFHLARAITIIRRGAAVERPEDVKTNGLDRLLLSGLSVLLAEDNPVNRKVAAEIPGNGESKEVLVNDGRSALENLVMDSFNIALLDIQMPELDGLEVAQSVRRRESRTGRHLPLVAVTAHTREEDRERCFEAGMDGFLAKPFGEEELVSLMGYALRQSRAKRRAGSEGTLVDREAALARANGDPLLLTELVDLFLEDVPEVRKALASSIAEGRFESVERLAHRVKDSLLTLSASDAARIDLDLEDVARSESAQRCHELLEYLLEDLDRLEAEFADKALRSQA